MAGAEYIDRSPPSETVTGADQLAPPLVDQIRRVRSLLSPAPASDQASTIALVAPAPVGAPLVMSTLGEALRSVRAPA